MAGKKRKKVLIVAIAVVAAILIVAASLVIYAFTDKDRGLDNPINTETVDPFFGKWQSYIDDGAKLNEIVTAGSHDAGSNEMMPLAMTQGHQISDQLTGGVRYFDLRVTKKGDELVIFHGIITGQKFSVVLGDIKTFIENHPTEFLILDFQHLGGKVHADVLAAIVNTLDMSKAMKKSECPEIETTTMGDVREKGYRFVIVWTDTAEAAESDFLYARNEHLYSPYVSEIHKSKDLNELVGYYQNYYDTYTGKGFFVLQAQRTAPNLLDKPSQMEQEFKPVINAYIDALADSANLAKTNIIMRDFIVSDMENVKKILKLNLDKNLVKAELRGEYANKVTNSPKSLLDFLGAPTLA